MTLLEQFVDCMKRGDNVGLADLFDDYGVLHDSSLIKIGQDTMHLEGKMAVEMMFHHKFGFNGGPFPIFSPQYQSERNVWYMITYKDQVVPVSVDLSAVTPEGKIKRINIYPL